MVWGGGVDPGVPPVGGLLVACWVWAGGDFLLSFAFSCPLLAAFAMNFSLSQRFLRIHADYRKGVFAFAFPGFTIFPFVAQHARFIPTSCVLKFDLFSMARSSSMVMGHNNLNQ